MQNLPPELIEEILKKQDIMKIQIKLIKIKKNIILKFTL